RPVLNETDIDNDGIPELLVEFPHATWIYHFQSQSSALKLWGPTLARQDGVTSYLGSATLLDVDGDGVLEIIEFDSRRGATAADLVPYTVYKVASDGTATRTDVRPVFVDRFFGADETQETRQPPQFQLRSFAATPGDYNLRIVNGDQKRNYAVSSAEIRLNGVTILGSGDLNGKRRILTVPVTLHDVNQLTVEVRDPGSELSVIIARGL
ncbi:MAG TPA: VCBS repeat-containing protein, partial [Thermoanaerobaculia bacterium]